MGEESKWAFERLLNIQRKQSKALTGVTLDYLRKIFLNSVLDPSVKTKILAFLETTLQPSSRSTYRRPLSEFEKTKFLVRVQEYDKALEVSERIMGQGNSPLLRNEAKLWHAHILGLSGQNEKARELFEKSNLNKSGYFFLESYASTLMRSGRYAQAASVFDRALEHKAHYRLRWYKFWSLEKAKQYRRAKFVNKVKEFSFCLTGQRFEEYWNFIIERKSGDPVTEQSFRDPFPLLRDTCELTAQTISS